TEEVEAEAERGIRRARLPHARRIGVEPAPMARRASSARPRRVRRCPAPVWLSSLTSSAPRPVSFSHETDHRFGYVLSRDPEPAGAGQLLSLMPRRHAGWSLSGSGQDVAL